MTGGDVRDQTPMFDLTMGQVDYDLGTRPDLAGAIVATHNIVETNVGGVLAYHADCSACEWESRSIRRRGVGGQGRPAPRRDPPGGESMTPPLEDYAPLLADRLGAPSTSPAPTPERVYVMTKVAAGDWLLPSNDARTVWRIRRYEDGPSHGIIDTAAVDWPRDREVWGVWRWIGDRATQLDDLGVAVGQAVDVDADDSWQMVAQTLDTRQEAIEEAMRLE